MARRSSDLRKSFGRRRYIKSVAGVGAVGLTGCVGGGSSNSTTFRFIAAATDPDLQDQYQTVFEEYSNSRDDLELNYQGEFLSNDDFLQKMNTYIGSGNVPDLAYGGANLAAFSDQWEPIGDIMNENNVPDNLQIEFPNTGKLIHPVALETIHRWQRTDVWEEAGIDYDEHSEPKSWSTHETHLEAVSDVISDDKNASFYLASSVDGAMQQYWGPYEVHCGVNYIRRTGPSLEEVEVSLGDEREGAIQYLEHGKRMYDSFSPNTTSGGFNELISLYVNDNVAQAQYGGRLMNNLISQAPELEDVTDFGYMEMPDENPAPANHLVSHGSLSYPEDYGSNIAINGFAVPSDGSNSDIAKDFLRWFFDSEHYAEIVLSVAPHTIPVDPGMLDEEPYSSNEIWQRHQEYKEFLQETLPACYPKVLARTDPVSPYWYEITYGSGIVTQMQQEVLLGRKSPDQAIDEAIPKLESATEEAVQRYS